MMDIRKAILVAQAWTKDLRSEERIPIFEAMQSLLAHIRRQEQDIEELTNALRAVLRQRKVLEDDVRRSKKTRS